MNRNTEQHITLEIPASRQAFWDWYEAERNKRMIYYLALSTWVVFVLHMIIILSLTATSFYRSAFYVPLLLFALLFGPLTHWLLQAALNDYDVRHKSRYHSVELELHDNSYNIDLKEPHTT